MRFKGAQDTDFPNIGKDLIHNCTTNFRVLINKAQEPLDTKINKTFG